MRKLAFSAMFIGAFGLLTACGGGGGGDDDDDDTIMLPDAGDDDDDDDTVDAMPAACNPVAQTGCTPDEKCTQLVVSAEPFLARTDCVPDGTVDNGGACTQGEAGETTGFDDCVGGNLCVGGVCTEICTQAPNSCPATEVCVPFVDTFEDVEGTGLCQPTCDPLAQDCATEGEGCYLSLFSGEASCAPALPEMKGGEPGVQGEDCMFLNTCAVGFGCILVNDAMNPTGNVCAEFCDPMGVGPNCSLPSLTCAQINMFYSDTENVDDRYGMCIDCEVFAGLEVCGGGME